MKTRVSKRIKQALQAIADARHISASDIHREAFREFISKNETGKSGARVA